MPSSMIHLYTANRYINDLDNLLFYIGNLAPDSFIERTKKDLVHLRNEPNKKNALLELRNNIDLTNIYEKGILLHLFLDYKWDEVARTKFADIFMAKGSFDFLKYRKEISISTLSLYHNFDWSKDLWENMVKYPLHNYPQYKDFNPVDINKFILSSRKWHQENIPITPTVFTLEFIENFTDELLIEFKSDF